MPSTKCVATFRYDGKKYYVRADSKEEAKSLALQKKQEMEQGKLYRESMLTVGEWFEEYMEAYKADAKPKTIEDYRGIYRNGIAPYIGHMPLKTVKPINCQKVMNASSHRSASYIHKVYILMNGMFSAAVDNELLNRNPAIRTVKPKGHQGFRRALTKDERKAFINACVGSGDAGLYCLIIYYCGLRPSEVNRIRGGDYTDTMLKVRGEKTAASVRTVPIPSALTLPKIPKGKLLFTKGNGEMRDKDAQRRYWIRVKAEMMKQGKVADDLTLYCLRHDYCTRLQEAKVPIDVARRLMGHSSVEVTSRIYTHGNDKILTDTLDLLNGQTGS